MVPLHGRLPPQLLVSGRAFPWHPWRRIASLGDTFLCLYSSPMTETSQESRTERAGTAASRPVLGPLALVFAVTIAAQLVSLAFGRVDMEREFAKVLVPSILFLSALTLPLAGLGITLGRAIGLGTRRIDALWAREPGALAHLWRDAAVAALLGLLLGAGLLALRLFTASHLPPELPAFGHRGVIGGLAVSIGAAVAEEVWFRLGLMTLLAWCLVRLTGNRTVRPIVAWPIILITATAFGMAHLPQLMSYGAGSPFAIAGTVLGNVLVGTLYGWCYWRRGLIAAMAAHLSVDLMLHVVPALPG